MWRNGVISGTVREQDGQPAIGLTVQLLRPATSPGEWWFASRSDTTDDRGHYRVSDLTPGRYLIVVSPAGPRNSAVRSSVYFPGVPTASTALPIVVRAGGFSLKNVRYTSFIAAKSPGFFR